MTLLFRSKSCKLDGAISSAPPSHPTWGQEIQDEEEEEEEEYETEEEEDDDEYEDEDDDELYSMNPISTPFRRRENTKNEKGNNNNNNNNNNNGNNNGQLTILDFVVATLRKSLLVTCSVEREEISSLDISCPTNVRHVSHVTFDRFNGFLGLPDELQPDVPRRVPSASASVFGVSPQSMQCIIDERGHSIPTLLITMQKRLYAQGGFQAEGIFRINAENSQEECVRNQLNKGVVPRDIDVHCLAGLIKAWFRELPKGVLDSLSPEQVMHCNTEEQSTQLVKKLPAMEAGLLDWAINLMADVVQQEHHNKMNARNIAMVFAPNMTQMADPLTALIHAVQVMNLLKRLIERILRLRLTTDPNSSTSFRQLIFTAQREAQTKLSDEGKTYGLNSGGSSPAISPTSKRVYEGNESEGILDRLNFRKGVKKLCRHPVFQLSK